MKKSIAAMFFTAVFLTACGGGDSGETLINETKVINEGQQLSYQIKQPGTYRANITASNHGIIVSWPGSSTCPGSSAETKAYTASCVFPSTGQLVISNPTTLGLGGDEIVTITIVRER